MERNHLQYLTVDRRIILKWIFNKGMRRNGLDCPASRKGQVAGTCECGNEASGSIKCGEFLDHVRTC
jgi:hypothetical protein